MMLAPLQLFSGLVKLLFFLVMRSLNVTDKLTFGVDLKFFFFFFFKLGKNQREYHNERTKYVHGVHRKCVENVLLKHGEQGR